MTYDATETGPLGRPVEGYEFLLSGTFYRVTSAATPQTFGGSTFEVLEGLGRSEPRQSTDANSGEITIQVPNSFEIANIFRGTLPSSLPTLTIYQKHLNDAADESVVVWKGTIVSSEGSDGRRASLKGLPSTSLFSRIMPRVVYSALCNHQLFDAGCTVNRDAFKFTGILPAGDALGTTFSIAGLRAQAAALQATHSTSLSAQELDDYWLRGYIKAGTTNPEWRMIVETDVGGDPDAVRVNYPFRLATSGSSIEVFAGCNHAIDLVSGHCQRKFLNAVNFGGFPYVPTVNPFSAELDSGLNNASAPSSSTSGGRFR